MAAALWLGVADGAETLGQSAFPRLIEPCPGTAHNCVSSRDRVDANYIPPLFFDGPAEVAWQDLLHALHEEARTVIQPRGAFVLHAESVSLVFRFVDDLDFQLIPEEGIIEVRSASRLGYWDLGVNRRRIERIRERFNALGAQH